MDRWVVLLALPVLLLFCSDKTDTQAEASADGGEQPGDVSTRKVPGPIKIDFLWVLDHSPSMCQEQRELARGFKDLAKALHTFGEGAIDTQMAVITAQQAPGGADDKIVGRFKHRPATVFPPNCFERIKTNCLGDAQCHKPVPMSFAQDLDSSLCTAKTGQAQLKTLQSGKWTCRGPKGETGAIKAGKMSNFNCSLNCSYQACVDSLRSCCTTGESWCKETKPDLVALNKTMCAKETVEMCEYLTPYGACKRKIAACCQGPHDEACTQPKDAAECEARLKSECDALEGKAGLVPETCQATRLVRPDAWLVLVFISDDDDCSLRLDVHPHDKTKLGKDVWSRCQLFANPAGENTALAEARCEVRKAKFEGLGQAVFCPSDCLEGSTRRTPGGAPKCPFGCKKGSAQRLDCSKKADQEMKLVIAKHFGPDSPAAKYASVADFVKRFKSLKADPSKIMVAVVAGDTKYADPKAVAGTPAAAKEATQRHRDRVHFYRSMLEDVGPGQAPYICLGHRGEAGFGARYIALAEAFGERGAAFNLCKGSDLGPALRGMVEKILASTR